MKKKSIILIFMAIATFFGCVDDNQATHPDEGSIVMTMDWSNIQTAIPSTVQVYIESASGKNRLFENLDETSNILSIHPGEAILYVYNHVEHITIVGNKAKIRTQGSGIVTNPGNFYTFSKKITTERDKTVRQTALMVSQTGDLKMSIAIKPASMIEKVRSVSAVLSGVATELNMQTNELSAPSTISFNLLKNTYYATSAIQLFGFSQPPILQLDIEYENGHNASISSDLSALVTNFNNSKNKPFSLNTTLTIADDVSQAVTIGQWNSNAENRYLSVSSSDVLLKGNAFSDTIFVITDQPIWVHSISKNGDWLTTTQEKDRLIITVAENTKEGERKATINISAGGASEQVCITQQMMALLSLSASEITLAGDASTESLYIDTNQLKWDFHIFQTGDWLTASQSDDRLLLSTTANTTSAERMATIVISAGELSEQVEVTQKVLGYLTVTPTDIVLSGEASSESISVSTNLPSWEYRISQTGNWLTVSQSNDRITLTATANTTSAERQATIFITVGELSEQVSVRQKAIDNQVGNNYYADKETVKLQSATIGRGINIVLMGDGYTTNEMQKGTGKYEQDMRTATEHFFSVYPLSDYRNYFNVYMIAAISNQSGMSNASTGSSKDTKFKTLWEGAPSTAISCNYQTVLSYLNAINDLSSAYVHDITVIMPINEYVYAGTCYMFSENRASNYSNGLSIAMCPVGYAFKEVVVHESVGHGFAKAADEYVYYRNETILQTSIDLIQGMKPFGWYENVDFSSNILQTTWKGFAGLSRYSMVSTFEGASMYGKGIWKPEFNSCMNNNIFYFNAPTRWALVRRVYSLSGIIYTFSQFLLDDKIPEVPVATRSVSEFFPFAPPVIKYLYADELLPSN